MTGRTCAATEQAVAESIARPGLTLTTVAHRHAIALSTLKRALRKRGIPPRSAVSGPAHHAYRGA